MFLNLPPAQPDVYYVGIDVGTGSARACVIDTNGIILGLSERPIKRAELKPNYITQSSTEIWNAICFCVKHAVREAGIDPSDVFGIGFDATCSLVVLRESTNEPVGVGPDFTDNSQNIVLWMDHRAVDETIAINSTGDKSLKYVGGQMSIEMELPKMKWLKHNLPGGIEDCKFYDLADFLTHRATDSECRSYCSVVCKQGFVPPGVDNSETGWSKEFLESLDLPELVEDNFRRLGGIPGKNGKFLCAGDIVGKLTEKAAEELGLSTDCVVGSGVIDAYAGWIGTVAAEIDVPDYSDQKDNSIGVACGRLAAVAGTSTCHIAMTKDPCFVRGVWGPYKDVIAPGYWLAEGGQSCTGALLAHVLATHPAHSELVHLAETDNLSKFDYLNSVLETLRVEKGARSVVSLAKDIFYYGDFHGNRSPIADPNMRASIIGQSMDTSVQDLALQYFGACEFIAQQTRQIIEEMEKSGHRISYIFMSGGQCRNGLLMRLLADCTGKRVIIPRYIDAAVVFGSALLGAVAAEGLVAEHISSKGRSRKPSHSATSKRQSIDPPSPYTAPTATASSTNMTALAYSSANHGSHTQFQMTPMAEESYFNLEPKSEKDDESDEEETLSFGSKQKTQQNLSQKFNKLGLKPLSTYDDKTETQNSGDRLWHIMTKMTGPGRTISPASEDHPDRKLLHAKYLIFLEQAYKQIEYRKIVADVEAENVRDAKRAA